VFAATLAALCLYYHLLHVHLGGRLLDTHRRVHATAHQLFTPHDLELSAVELRAVLARAKKWRGPKGEERRLVVSEYELLDAPSDDGGGGGGSRRRSALSAAWHAASRRVGPEPAGLKISHVAIYQLGGGAPRNLHRHFLIAADGSVVELFGSVANLFAGEFGRVAQLVEGEDAPDQEAAGPAARAGSSGSLPRQRKGFKQQGSSKALGPYAAMKTC